MRKYQSMIFFILVFFCFQSIFAQPSGQTDIWIKFVAMLKEGTISKENIKPYHASLQEPLLHFLTILREEAQWNEWQHPQECKRVGSKIHYILPLTFGSTDTATYVFSFVMQDEQWFFHHMENIIIRLDSVDTFPASDFPSIPAEHMHWILEEERWSFVVYMFNILANEKGKEFALNTLRDGGGYLLQAKTWVPLAEPEKAFVLFLCWDLSVRRGCKLVLQNLTESEAIISFESQFIKLYKTTGHLQSQISFEDYQQIFTTIWQDRAEKAGWHLEILNDGELVEFHLQKHPL